MTIVSTPKAHVCEGLNRPIGGVWWGPTLEGRSHTDGLIPSIWRREGRLERWLRERRER